MACSLPRGSLAIGSLFALFLVPGCLKKPELPDLRQANKLKIDYHINQQPKSLVISDPKQVKDIISTVKVRETWKDVHPAFPDVAVVWFFFPAEEKRFKAKFSPEPTNLATEWGMLYLESDAFYQKINEVVSKHEGRPVEILKEKFD
ncbi:MAG: hypothetical protein G01um101438_187 [Parcubacteria group bacterium Gr01-1014_38]|nr:MAG: hypothetical protein G01um101438_187 [Parcubacteria group bacterium Gr01-1014_38]